jgi:hypothetical protein
LSEVKDEDIGGGDHVPRTTNISFRIDHELFRKMRFFFNTGQARKKKNFLVTISS